MEALEISPCTNATLTFDFDFGLDHPVHGGYGWGSPTPRRRNNCQTKKIGTKTNWPTDCRSHCNLKLNLCHCTANYEPVLSSERAPYMKNKGSKCHSNKCIIWSLAPKGARHQDELSDWLSVLMWLWLSLERALQSNKPATIWRKFHGERKIGRGSQMGAWHQDRLTDWLSVVNQFELELAQSRLSHFPTSWKEAIVVALPKPGKDPKFTQNLRPINLLPSTGKVFEKVILEIVKRHIWERNLLNAKSVWLPCTSQHDTAMYEASGPRRLKF
jgi:hypothetical protein